MDESAVCGAHGHAHGHDHELPGSPPPVSTCVITGLTGTGKTSLVRSLLESLPTTARVAVCIHHHAKSYGLETTCPSPPSFGSDDPRLAAYCEVYDFGSGCICCSPDGDLTHALVALGRERHALATAGGSEGRLLTHCIVETTGLADPRPFSRLIGAEPLISQFFSLDRVVCVLRGEDCRERLAEAPPAGLSANKAVEQLRNSEAVLIVNGSGAGTEEHEALRVSPRAWIVPREGGRVGWDALMARKRERERDHLPCGACEDEYIKVVQLVNIAGHDQTYTTACAVEKGGVVWRRAEEWLMKMLGSGNVIQVKGFLAVQCDDDPTDEAYVDSLSAAHPSPSLERIVTVCGEMRAGKVSLHVECVEKGGVCVDVAKHSAMSKFLRARDSAAIERGDCKLFILGTGLKSRDFGEELRKTMVPDAYVPIADLDLDFPEVAEGCDCGMRGVLVELEEGLCPGQDGNAATDLALFCMGRRFFATAAHCANGAHPLHLGTLSVSDAGGAFVTCKECSACFDLKGGSAMARPGGFIKTFPVRVAGNLVYVGLGGG